MPIYEYECQKCKKVHEIWQKITEDPVKKCPTCKGKVERIISAVGFELKGGGWYKDGYGSKKSGSSESSGSDSSASSAVDSSAKTSTGDSGKPPKDLKAAARAKAEKAEKAQDIKPAKLTDPHHKSNSPKAKN